MYETVKLKYTGDRKIMKVKYTTSHMTGTIYEVPMPIEGDEFQINGVIFQISYQRDNPFRIKAEPTGTVILDVVKKIVEAQRNEGQTNEPERPGTTDLRNIPGEANK